MALAAPAAAQSSQIDLEGAYLLLHRSDFTSQGWNIAVATSVARAVSIVGEISRLSKTESVSQRFAEPLEYWTGHTTFAGGIRLGGAHRSAPGNASASVQFLVGLLDVESTVDRRNIVDFPDKALLLQPGVAFAVTLTHRLSAFGQADYRHAVFTDASFNYLRGLVGLQLVFSH